MRLTAKIFIKLILLTSLLSIQCKNKKETDSTPDAIQSGNKHDTSSTDQVSFNQDSVSKMKTKPTDSLKTARNKLTAESIKSIKRIEFLSINKGQDSTDSDDKFLNPCKKWALDNKTIERIFRNSNPISGEVWHLVYDDLPCYMKGEIIINDLVFKFEVNAGSHIVIWNTDTTFRYGVTGKKFKKYFLSEPWDPAKGE